MKGFNKQVIFWSLLTAVVLSVVLIPEQTAPTPDKKQTAVVTETVSAAEELTACDVKTQQKKILATQVESTQAGIAVKPQFITAGAATVEEKVIPVVAIAQDTTEEAAQAETTTEAVTEITAEAVEPAVDEWANRVMANVEESANIRATADENGELVGRLKKGDAAEVTEAGSEWTKITSGSVTGYVKNEYLAFGDAARQIAEAQARKAVILTETLRVRREANEAAEVVTLVSGEAKYDVVSEQNGWVEIRLESGATGFVAADYVRVDLILGSATSIEEELAAQKAAKEAAEKAAKEAEAKKQKEEAKKNASQSTQTTQREAVSASTDDLTLLGAVIQLEAGGESYDCKLAVASVVLNRVNSSKFPNSISGVVYQSGQFPGASNGKLARILSNGVNSSCINAAQDALNGSNNIGGYLYFNMTRGVNTSRLSDYTIIGNECFY